MALNSVRAILLDPKDDVAAVLYGVDKGDTVTITDAVSGKPLMHLDVRQKIPFGHKVALREIASDKPVLRYGWPIGIATADIRVGEHVHSHNMRSALSPVPKQTARDDDSDRRQPCSAAVPVQAGRELPLETHLFPS